MAFEDDDAAVLHLGGEDVAGAPCDISSKLKQGLDQDGGLWKRNDIIDWHQNHQHQ